MKVKGISGSSLRILGTRHYPEKDFWALELSRRTSSVLQTHGVSSLPSLHSDSGTFRVQGPRSRRPRLRNDCRN